MASSEKITEKNFNIIEKALQDIIANENTKILLREYKDFLQDELSIQKENENVLQGNLEKLTSVKDFKLEAKCLKLQEAVNDRKTYDNQLRDEIDNLIIQSMADRETLKSEKAEIEQQITSHYETEVKKLKKQFENNKNEQEKIEQELENQITLEFATRDACLGEIRGNLQRQVVEKNSVLIKMQNEHKDLRKELNMLKAQEKSINNQNKNTNPRHNVMEFHNEFLIQKNQTNKSVNPNEFINVYPPTMTSNISEYNTTEPENHEYLEFANSHIGLAANNFGQHNSGLNQQTINNNNNQNYVTSIGNNQQFLLNYNDPSNITRVSNHFTENQTSSNSVTRNQLTNQEKTYFSEDYNHFNDAFTESFPNIDKVNAKSLKLVPNPLRCIQTAGSDSLIPNNKRTSAFKKSKVEAQRSSERNTIIMPKHNDSLKIEDPDMFDEELIKDIDHFAYDTNPSDVPRKAPKVYMGETKRKKTHTKTNGSTFKENYGVSASTLNAIIAAKKKISD